MLLRKAPEEVSQCCHRLRQRERLTALLQARLVHSCASCEMSWRRVATLQGLGQAAINA